MHLDAVDAGADAETCAIFDLATTIAGRDFVHQEIAFGQIGIQNHGVVELRAVVELNVHAASLCLQGPEHPEDVTGAVVEAVLSVV